MPMSALVEVEAHLRVALPKIAHRARQGITRLRMGGGNRQAAGGLLAEFLSGTLQVLGIVEHVLDDRHDQRAHLGQRRETFAGAHEQVHTEFFLQLADLPTHAGLRGVQHLGHFGEVEAAADRFAHGAQLLKIHGGAEYPGRPICAEARKVALLMRPPNFAGTVLRTAKHAACFMPTPAQHAQLTTLKPATEGLSPWPPSNQRSSTP
jgi:hypothetical protein